MDPGFCTNTKQRSVITERSARTFSPVLTYEKWPCFAAMGEEVEILRPHPIPRYTVLVKPENAQGKPRISVSTHLISSVSDNKLEQFTTLGRHK